MKTNHLLRSLTVATAVTALAGCASTNPPVSQSVLRAMDTNRDGKVSQPEYSEAKLREAFQKLDLNGDQVITLDEWKQIDTSLEAEEHFKALDENGDEQISLAEFLKLAPQHSNLDELFRELDQNADHYLSADELGRDTGLKVFSIQF